MADKTIRIGGGSAFWGDTELGPVQLVRKGRIDYLILDYLAEVTMALLVRARARSPTHGYARDFVTDVMAPLLPEIARQGIRVVTNAGGINPMACRDALRNVAREAGIDLPVAVVVGDDLLPGLERVRSLNPREMDTGEPLPAELTSMNAYLGARPIAAALDTGAQVVITGRCVDSALTLGPLMHEFGWRDDQLDLLAAGSLAGHLIECGAQATGGIFTDWERVERYDDIGFPVAECSADGGCVITKPPDTGGLVTEATVGEQMLYEIGDPRAYLLPDVTCDFTAVNLSREGRHRVRVTGARGRPATDTYKVCATFGAGWRATTTVMLGGGRAAQKARKLAEIILTRTRRMLRERGWDDYTETSVEVIGAEDTYGDQARGPAPREVILKLAVRHPEKEALALFSREIAPGGTGMMPGLTGFFAGRPGVVPVIKIFSFLIPKGEVAAHVVTDGGDSGDGGKEIAANIPVSIAPGEPLDLTALPAITPDGAQTLVPEPPTVTVPLETLAWGRSGDKGDHANIGILARRAEFVPVIRGAVTEESVAHYFAHILRGHVQRYELPGVDGFNFVLHHVLGGGGTASLRMDPQGKAFAQMLLDMPVAVPEEWVQSFELPVMDSAAG